MFNFMLNHFKLVAVPGTADRSCSVRPERSAFKPGWVLGASSVANCTVWKVHIIKSNIDLTH